MLLKSQEIDTNISQPSGISSAMTLFRHKFMAMT